MSVIGKIQEDRANAAAANELAQIKQADYVNGLAAGKVQELEQIRNMDVGYGISAGELSQAWGIPVNEVVKTLQDYDNSSRMQDPYGPKAHTSDDVLQKYAAEKQAYINNAIGSNRTYQNNKRDAEQFGDVPGPDGKYTLVQPNNGNNLNIPLDVQGGSDYITRGIDKLQSYFINKPRIEANKYNDNVDQGLAAQWRGSYR